MHHILQNEKFETVPAVQWLRLHFTAGGTDLITSQGIKIPQAVLQGHNIYLSIVNIVYILAIIKNI